MAELLCGLCLTAEGEVHQCNEGHCYCVTCWRIPLEPRRCPECCQPIQDICRNRNRKSRIAALGSCTCEYCNDATMRGEALIAHMRACPQRSICTESKPSTKTSKPPVAPTPAAAPVVPVAPAAAPAAALPVAYAHWRRKRC